MPNKTYLSIIGPSTVGKSTLAHALLSFGDKEVLSPVQQTTTRDVRADDNKFLIKTLSNEAFKKSRFLVKHDQYGILWGDFLKFCEAVQSVGFSVNGPNEVSKLKRQYTSNSQEKPISVDCINIMIRFSSDRRAHKEAVENGIKKHFNKTVAAERLIINDNHDNNFYYNRAFIKNHIDIVLSREYSLKEWIYEIENKLEKPVMSKDMSEQVSFIPLWARI